MDLVTLISDLLHQDQVPDEVDEDEVELPLPVLKPTLYVLSISGDMYGKEHHEYLVMDETYEMLVLYLVMIL